ncbi:M48 family metalloprotease [Candidatus Thiothrix sp. Deng01]|uniref:M48 family metalloprotease n=1 Tax=Candidatus Thiothrix phosphatis TaxID=3112415 RepID=A0ABU6D339_9GAMM|nr:M48 family metalloprotease [Candidatus Thiothrix sp. Deng01]MEB4593458.1 M48 family metalloprotease [Candidatus Thiothrix sp. Deng01]
MRLALIFFNLLVGSAMLVGCAANPVTGKSELALMSESEEMQAGQQANQEVLQQTPAYRDPTLQAYVSRIGQMMAAQSPRQNLRFSFTVLDDPAVNAFALPGGYVYITSGLMAYLNSEAELAGVLGHEIGHVSARHNVSQASWSAVGGILASVAGEKLGNKDLFNTIGELGLTHYSRQQELEADGLGAQFLASAGYDPVYMANVIATLQAYDQFTGGSTDPYRDLFSTHPSNDVRLQQLISQARQYGRGGRDPGHEAYLRQTNGLRLPLGNGETVQIRLVTTRPGDTFESLAQSSRLRNNAAMHLRVFNGMYPSGEPRPGQLIKTIQ